MTIQARLGRRQMMTIGGAAALMAVGLPHILNFGAAAQDATPASATPASPGATPRASPTAGDEILVSLTTADAEIVVRIADNPTSADFVSMLPLTLEFQDFSSMEKISYLPRELTIEGSNGQPPVNGDLIYFVPWGTSGFSTTPPAATHPLTTG